MTDNAPGNAPSCLLTLNEQRQRTAGSEEALAAAIRRGADLRIYTEFRYDEHVDPSSHNTEVVREKAAFNITYLLDDRWTAGIMSLRAPILPPRGFGPRVSMSYFIYNQDGHQAIARLHLDGAAPAESQAADDDPDRPKQHVFERWDVGTNSPSQDFVYDFGTFRYFVRDDWHEVLAHGQDGDIVGGSLDALTDAFHEGRDVKVAARGLCADLVRTEETPVNHEVFVEVHSGFHNTESRIFTAGTHPVVRVRPRIPLGYGSRAWDSGWLMVRTDGFVARWLVDPSTLKFHKSWTRHELRWFVR